jgi:phytoene dehydrogenase-like protein
MLSNALKKERAVGSRCSDPSAPWSLLPHEGTNTMPDREALDAIVVGAGPNGLAAAITLAQAGLAVRVYEARDRPGGGVRSAELTLPGFTHDVCSAIHPLGVGSPFFRTLPLDKHGLEWIQAPAALAHPFDDGTAALLERSVEMTSETLGEDARAYRRLMSPLVADWGSLGDVLLGPMRFPRHPFVVLRFGWRAIRSAHHLAEAWFKTERARGFFAGLAAHAIMPLEKVLTSAFGLLLGMLGHVVGWPFPRGGAQQITDALVSYFRGLGGELVTNAPIGAIDELPPARAILLDVTPLQLLQLAGKRLPAGYRHRLARYRYGPGVFKVDWALDGPIPWRSALCIRAGTVHVGGTLAEIAAAERAVWRSEHAERPFVLVAQQSLFDPTRAPSGKQVAWGYCHVPNGFSRAPNRTLRSGFPGTHPCTERADHCSIGAVQSKLHRRGHQWWGTGSLATLRASRVAACTICDAGTGSIYLLSIDTTWRWCTWDVRVPCGAYGVTALLSARERPAVNVELSRFDKSPTPGGWRFNRSCVQT